MKKILFILGTRPEAIKLVPLIREVKIRKEFQPVVCVTGQHREMMRSVLESFSLTPDIDFDLMSHNQSLLGLSVQLIQKCGEIISRINPTFVVVQGDTTTAAMAALAAFYLKVQVCHVEAGLRTWNRFSPYPEEVNRKIIGSLADLHFVPTVSNKSNLLDERVLNEDIHVVGNTVIDALKIIAESDLPIQNRQLSEILLKKPVNKKIVLVTAHRRESLDGGFLNICDALISLVKISNIEIVFPVHLNPLVREIFESKLAGIEGINLIEPLDYLDFVTIMKKVDLIISDSGGVQEEAPFLLKPVVVTRDTTERIESIEAGISVLVGANKDAIITEAIDMLEYDSKLKQRLTKNQFLYGDGFASQRIHNILAERSL
jgi:UDP-N-acetylglucosamine 2-epimerase (non-hydrolysing)